MKAAKHIRSYRFALKPTPSQERYLLDLLHTCRRIWNAAIEQRRWAWRNGRVRIKGPEQSRSITRLRNDKSDPEYDKYQSIPSSAMCHVTRRVDKAYAAAFRRLKRKEKPGWPKMHGARGPMSAEVQSARAIGDRLIIGAKGKKESIRIRLHRPLPEGAKIKMPVVGLDARGFYVCLQCEVPWDSIAQRTGECGPVGIDVGCRDIAALSDGTRVRGPRHLEKVMARLKVAQRKASRRARKDKNGRLHGKQSSGYRAAAAEVAKLHLKVREARKDFHNKLSRDIASKYDWISMEDLKVANLMKGPTARVLSDAAVGELREKVRYKAEEHGAHFALVPAHYTSQTCSECGQRTNPGSSKVFRCDHCGHVADRDVNAAIEILRRSADGPRWTEDQEK